MQALNDNANVVSEMLDARLWGCLSYIKAGSWSYRITGLHLSMRLEVATVYDSKKNILLFKKRTCMGDFSFFKDNFTPKSFTHPHFISNMHYFLSFCGTLKFKHIRIFGWTFHLSFNWSKSFHLPCLHNILKVISVILHSTSKFCVFSPFVYFLLFPNPPHFQQSSTSWPFTSLYYFPPHPSYIPSPLSLSLCAMVGGEWVCGGLICSLKRHASPSNASCRSFPSSFYPSLS